MAEWDKLVLVVLLAVTEAAGFTRARGTCDKSRAVVLTANVSDREGQCAPKWASVSSLDNASYPFGSVLVGSTRVSNENQTFGREWSQNAETTSSSGVRGRPWLSRVFSEQLWGFAPDRIDAAAEPECARHSLIYRQELDKLTLWAVQMSDSSSVGVSGLVLGDTHNLGHFDSCLSVSSDVAHRISGQYCLATIRLHITDPPLPDIARAPRHFTQHIDSQASVWHKLQVTADPAKKNRSVFNWGVCLPASCSAAAVERGLKRTLEMELADVSINGTVSVAENACYSNKQAAVSPLGYTIMGYLMMVFTITVVVCSAYDMIIYTPKSAPSKMQTIVLSFSVHKNLVSLTKPDPTSDLAVIHGMRAYSMFLIILGHRCLFSYGAPFHNPEFLENRYARFEDSLLLNGTLIVDTFLLLSGFLSCFMILQELQKTNRLRLSAIYIYRWLRITPMYMLMVAFYAVILPHLDQGPVWQIKAGVEAQRCQQNWWTNLLYINNYVNTDNLCMFQSWYIACDMHYSLLAPLLVYLLWNHPKRGLLVLTASLTLSILLPGIITYVYEYDGVVRVYMSLLEDPIKNEMYRNVYIASHTRAIPYIIGIAAAYAYYHMKARNIELSKTTIVISGVSEAVVALFALCYAWVFYKSGRPYDVMENAVYASMHRALWSAAMGWLIITSAIKGYGVLQPILTMKPLVPLSRLTYCVFLVHGLVQLYTVSILRSSEYMSFPKLFWMSFGDIAMSYVLGTVAYLIFEAPISNLLRIILLPAKVFAKSDSGRWGEPRADDGDRYALRLNSEFLLEVELLNHDESSKRDRDMTTF